MDRFVFTAVACFTLLFTGPSSRAAVVADYQFNQPGDTESWVDRGVGSGNTGLTSDGQSLTAMSPGADPQLKFDGALERAADAAWDTVTFRVRETQTPGGPAVAFDPTGMVVQINNGGKDGLTVSKPAQFEIETSDDGFTTVTVSIAAYDRSVIDELRIDPIGGTLNNSNSATVGNIYEIDFIQVTDTSVVGSVEPE